MRCNLTSDKRLLNIYISTIYTNDAPALVGTTNTFSKVNNDYCKDLNKLEHYLDIIFFDKKEYYKNFDRIRITGGELGDLDTEYLYKLYKLLEKYNSVTVYKNFTNTKISVYTNGRIFDKLSHKDIEDYKINTVRIFTMNNYSPEFYKHEIRENNIDNFYMKENQNIYEANKTNRFHSYAFILNDLSDKFFYDKFKNGDFIDIRILPFIKDNSTFAEYPYTLCNSKFYPGIISEDDSIDKHECSKYSCRFGIDLVNDKIFKCDFAFDDSPRIELNDENLKNLLEYNIENYIPSFDNDVCSNCTYYKCNYKLLSYNFKKRFAK